MLSWNKRLRSLALSTACLGIVGSADAATLTLNYTTPLDFTYLAGTFDPGSVPSPPAIDFVTATYTAGLDRLNTAFAPLLQKVEVSIGASSTDQIFLSNGAVFDRTLTYAVSEALTGQVTDPSLPSIGPVTSGTTNLSGSASVPFSFSSTVGPLAGSSLTTTATFTGAQAQQFTGQGQFNLELFKSGSIDVTANTDCSGCFENANLNSKLSGTATVAYTIAIPTSPIDLTFAVPLDHKFIAGFGGQGSPINSADFLTDIYAVALARLHPDLAPLLQEVEIAIEASNQDKLFLTNSALTPQTLNYQLTETLTAQVDDPALPAIGPVQGATASLSGSVPVPFSLSLSIGPFAGSTLLAQATFTGGQAQQFAGFGNFNVEFANSGSIGVTGDLGCLGCNELISAQNEISGWARVTYRLSPETQSIPEPATGPMLWAALGLLGVLKVKRGLAQQGRRARA